MSSALDSKMETTTCPLCANASVEQQQYDLAPYAAVQCSACKLWYLNPRLKEEEMIKLYANDTYFESSDESGYSSYDEQKANLKATFARFLKQMHDKGLTGGRLLEVGCGYGFLLEEAKPYFEYRAGTDYSEGAYKHLASVCDQAYLGGIDQVPESEKFDVIITVGVIEHIYSPIEFNNKLRAHLKAGGRLVHATPHMGSFWRPLMGKKWASFKVPEHVTYFDNNSLSNLFTKSGFSDLEELDFPHRFSLALVGQKLGIKLGKFLGGLNLWLPKTTLAIIGKVK